MYIKLSLLFIQFNKPARTSIKSIRKIILGQNLYDVKVAMHMKFSYLVSKTIYYSKIFQSQFFTWNVTYRLCFTAWHVMEHSMLTEASSIALVDDADFEPFSMLSSNIIKGWRERKIKTRHVRSYFSMFIFNIIKWWRERKTKSPLVRSSFSIFIFNIIKGCRERKAETPFVRSSLSIFICNIIKWWREKTLKPLM